MIPDGHRGHHMKKKKGRIGSSFDDFLKEEGIYEEVTAGAIRRVIARPRGRTTSNRRAGNAARRRTAATTESFAGLVQQQVKGDAKFAKALLREGIDAMLSGDL